MIYFGCIGQAGHHVYLTDAGDYIPFGHPWRTWLQAQDGRLAPLESQKQGVIELHHLFNASVTVIAMWDRTVDSRPNSNSMFLDLGCLSEDDMLVRAYHTFPRVVSRLGLEPRITGMAGRT